MKKTLLVAAASLFVIGQALAQGQPAPSGQTQNQKAAQQQTDKNMKSEAAGEKKEAKSAKKGGHRMARHGSSHHRMARKGSSHRMARANTQPQMGGFGGLPPANRTLKCKKGEKPNGITCM
jgi:hypothetical protein